MHTIYISIVFSNKFQDYHKYIFECHTFKIFTTIAFKINFSIQYVQIILNYKFYYKFLFILGFIILFNRIL